MVQSLKLGNRGGKDREVVCRFLVHEGARALEDLDTSGGGGLLLHEVLERLGQPRRHCRQLALQVVERLAHLAVVHARLSCLSLRLQALEVDLHGQDCLVNMRPQLRVKLGGEVGRLLETVHGVRGCLCNCCFKGVNLGEKHVQQIGVVLNSAGDIGLERLVAR